MRGIGWVLGSLVFGSCTPAAPSRTAELAQSRNAEAPLAAAAPSSPRPQDLAPPSDPVLQPAASAASVDAVQAADRAPVAFPDRREVGYGELIDEMRRVADELTDTPAVQDAHHALLAKTGLGADTLTLQSFSRIRLAFEATRDGGLWGIRWGITDQMPWSDQIWKQWRSAPLLQSDAAFEQLDDSNPVTAVAECDELSALFALVARDMGVDGFVGLHWPTWNHTVAVWQLRDGTGRPVRILVPTSQVFLSRSATLGTRELPTNRAVFPYPRHDLKAATLLPGPLARFLVGRLRAFGDWSSAALQERRNSLGTS